MKKSAKAGRRWKDLYRVRISADCQSSTHLLRIWISKALFCRNCYLGCIDCMCSSQTVSFFLQSLFNFLFFILLFLGIHLNPHMPLGLQTSGPGPWSAQHRSPGMGLGILVPSMRGSSVTLFSGSLMGSFPRCLRAWSPEARHSLLFKSLDEKPTNLFLQTAMYSLVLCQVTSPVNTTTSSFVKWG